MKHPPHKTAFTLIELLAVLVLMALLAAVVGFSLSGARNLASRAEVIDRIRAFDTNARAAAEHSPSPLSLVFNLSNRRVVVQDDGRQHSIGSTLVLPDTFAIGEVRVLGQTITNGSIAVPLSRRGTSPSYAFSVIGMSDNKERFLVIGLTGETISVPDEQHLQNILRLASAGHDAP